MSILMEDAPVNSSTVVIKNNFYPSGLTENLIYVYYLKNKMHILNEVKDREIMFFIGTDINKNIIKRKNSLDQFFKLTFENYNNLITGRTISIHSTMNQFENFGIVDIDCSDFEQAKEAALEVYNYLTNSAVFKEVKIRYTGKTAFHIFTYFDTKKNIDGIRILLKDLLVDSPFNELYLINKKRQPNKVNLDLSSNKFRGGFITLHSLSTVGLKCMELDIDIVEDFQKSSAKI